MTDMRTILSSIFLASATLFLASCGLTEKEGDGKGDAEAEASIMTDEGMEYTELAKEPLPCSKEQLSAAWKQIGSIEVSRRKSLDYRQHAPTFCLSTDLDRDGSTEVLMRGEPPYAAVFTYVKDSLHLVTFVANPSMGLGITQEGVIMRNGTDRDGALVSQFIRLENSQVAASGETRETFAIQGNAMVSNGTKYLLQTDTAMVEVSKDEYLQVAPQEDGTFFEDIDGWEDFRKP